MKWKFLFLVLLKVYFSYSQSSTTSEVVAEKKVDSSNCAIHFNKYEIGKRFYFPKIKEKGSDFKILMSYEFIRKDGKKIRDVFYDTLSEKTFKLHDIKDVAIRNKKNQVTESPYYLLKAEEDGLIIKYHYKFENLRNLEDAGTKINLILPEAIYLDEVDKFKQQYINKIFFANFQLKEKKYRKITVLNISPGTKDKPIRVFYSYDYQKKDTIDGKEVTENKVGKDSIDVCDCGTNVQRALIKNCKFSNFLLIEDPQKNVKDSKPFWDAIMDGRVVIGMKENHVIASLGKPLKIETDSKKADPVTGKPEKPKTTKIEKASGKKQDIDRTIVIKTMTYKNYIAVLENETVVSIKKIE